MSFFQAQCTLHKILSVIDSMDIPGVFKSPPNSEKKAIIYYNDNLEIKKITYGDLIECSLKIFKDLCRLEAQKSTILVLLPTNAYLLPPIILG